mgnify:CR=1 FL=1
MDQQLLVKLSTKHDFLSSKVGIFFTQRRRVTAESVAEQKGKFREMPAYLDTGEIDEPHLCERSQGALSFFKNFACSTAGADHDVSERTQFIASDFSSGETGGLGSSVAYRCQALQQVFGGEAKLVSQFGAGLLAPLLVSGQLDRLPGRSLNRVREREQHEPEYQSPVESRVEYSHSRLFYRTDSDRTLMSYPMRDSKK